MVKAGTIHAIGAGIFICEIQQNSNCTYRMYDYDRRDKFGNRRELHIDKAIDVVDVNKYELFVSGNSDVPEGAELLVSCKYFECYKYVLGKPMNMDDSSDKNICNNDVEAYDIEYIKERVVKEENVNNVNNIINRLNSRKELDAENVKKYIEWKNDLTKYIKYILFKKYTEEKNRRKNEER